VNCSVRNCQEFKEDGDQLFCKHHREEWYKYLPEKGEKMLPPHELEVLLLIFQDKVGLQ
jgi:hypothetical protein